MCNQESIKKEVFVQGKFSIERGRVSVRVFHFAISRRTLYVLSRPGLVFQRAATEIKYYYYFYSNFTSYFFLTCSNYTCISLVKHNSTSVLLQLGNSHICNSHKRLSVSNISSSNSGRTMRSPPQSYIYI